MITALSKFQIHFSHLNWRVTSCHYNIGRRRWETTNTWMGNFPHCCILHWGGEIPEDSAFKHLHQHTDFLYGSFLSCLPSFHHHTTLVDPLVSSHIASYEDGGRMMHMPVSKFLCYLEAEELAGTPCLHHPSFSYGCQRGVGAQQIVQIPLEGSGNSCHFHRILSFSKPSAAVAFSRIKIPKPTLEASLLMPTESARGVFESLLEHDSKSQQLHKRQDDCLSMRITQTIWDA